MVNTNDPIQNQKTSHIPRRDDSRVNKAAAHVQGRDKKDFKKIMDEDKPREVASKKKGKDGKSQSKETSANSGLSIFDHAAQKPAVKERAMSNEEIAETMPKSPKAPHSEFTREQPDISGIVSTNAQQDSAGSTGTGLPSYSTQATGAQGAQMSSRVEQIEQVQKLITKMVDQVTLMDKQGQTDTVVTLRHPPLFAGAKITLTGYETANKEFNVKFSELTPEAKMILEAQQAQNSLEKALAERGYTMHILVVTTEKEELIASSETSSSKREREEDEGEPQEESE